MEAGAIAQPWLPQPATNIHGARCWCTGLKSPLSVSSRGQRQDRPNPQALVSCSASHSPSPMSQSESLRHAMDRNHTVYLAVLQPTGDCCSSTAWACRASMVRQPVVASAARTICRSRGAYHRSTRDVVHNPPRPPRRTVLASAHSAGDYAPAGCPPSRNLSPTLQWHSVWPCPGSP